MKKIFILGVVFLFLGTTIQAFSLEKIQKYINDDEIKAKEVLVQLLYKQIRDFGNHKQSIIRKKKTIFLQSYLLEQYPSLHSIHTSKNDDGLTKYVGSDIFYTKKIYTPKDLQEIENNKYLVINDKKEKLRKISYLALQKLAKAYYHVFHKPLRINSARRSYFYQQNHFQKECFDKKICAQPGTSEHQNGYTIDIAHMYHEEYQRMKTHAHEYGFHQSYQKESDGLQIEPWHRRYLGVGFATYLYEHNMSFTDWVKSENEI